MKYRLFTIYQYYPEGGMNDLVNGVFDSVDRAEAYALSDLRERSEYQIVDENFEIVKKTRVYVNYGRDHPWQDRWARSVEFYDEVSNKGYIVWLDEHPGLRADYGLKGPPSPEEDAETRKMYEEFMGGVKVPEVPSTTSTFTATRFSVNTEKE